LIIVLCRDQAPRGPGGLGEYLYRTARLLFWVPAVERMPVELLSILIAHELGHAYRIVTCQDTIRSNPSSEKHWIDWEEEEVGQLLALWHIDEEPLYEWEDEHTQKIRELAANLPR
jgi:hypothetical protein